METLRVLLAIADFPPFMDGGVAEASERTFEALLRQGLDVNIIVGRPQQASPSHRENVHYVSTPFYRSPALRYLSFNMAAEAAKRKAVKHTDVFHTLSGIFGDLGLSPLRNAVRITTIYNTLRAVHESLPTFRTTDRFTRRAYYASMLKLEGRLSRASDAVVVSSKATAEDVIANYLVAEERVHVVHLGIDPQKTALPERRHVLTPDKPYLLAVSRIVPRKGIEDIIEMFHLLAADWPDLRLVLVGRGDAAYDSFIQQRIAQLGVAGRVIQVSDLAPEELSGFYHHAELLVTCSRVEGFGLAPAEAMACGLPVVAYDIPGIRDVVVEGVSGRLVAPHTPRAMAREIGALLHNPLDRSRLSQGAYESAKKFSWEATARRLLEVYRTALDGQARRM